MSKIHTIFDHITDITGIVALCFLAQQSAPVSDGMIGAITTIALGHRYLKEKYTNTTK